jgi:hypothetical protein
MRRRVLLASGTTVLATTVAGCAGFGRNPSAGSSNLVGTAPAARLSMTAATAAELPARVLYVVRANDDRNERADSSTGSSTGAPLLVGLNHRFRQIGISSTTARSIGYLAG